MVPGLLEHASILVTNVSDTNVDDEQNKKWPQDDSDLSRVDLLTYMYVFMVAKCFNSKVTIPLYS